MAIGTLAPRWSKTVAAGLGAGIANAAMISPAIALDRSVAPMPRLTKAARGRAWPDLVGRRKCRHIDRRSQAAEVYIKNLLRYLADAEPPEVNASPFEEFCVIDPEWDEGQPSPELLISQLS